MASASEELELLERVILRIGGADTDEQLESYVNKFLIPVLLKLSSNNDGVRKKVMELLVHVNTRIKRRPAVQLPVEALIKQYCDPEASSFLVNFSVLYIKVGYPRLTAEKQQELAPLLAECLAVNRKQHNDSFLLLLMGMIGSTKIPTDLAKRKALLGVDKHPANVPLLSAFMLDVLLMPYIFVPSSNEEPAAPAPPGLSPSRMAKLSSPEIQLTGETLEKTKRGIVELLVGGFFPPEETVVHLLIATSDTRFTVTDIADTEINRIVGSVDWSNSRLGMKLFIVYLGTLSQPNLPDDQKRQPANARIRLKLLPFLTRLYNDAICFPFCLQVVFDSVYGATTKPKIQQLAMNFALSMVKRSDEQLLKKISPMLYTGLLKLVWLKDKSSNLKAIAYTTIGQIVQRVPSIINKNLTELQVFFDNLCCDDQEIRTAVRDALLCMVDAFKLAMASEESEPMEVDNEKPKLGAEERNTFMVALLSSQIEDKEQMARFVAVKYAATVFPCDHVISRYLLLIATGDSVSNVSTTAKKALYAMEAVNDEKEAPLELPGFVEMVECVAGKLKNRNPNIKLNTIVFEEILHYLRCCLARSAGVEITRKTLIVHPCVSSPLIGDFIRSVHAKNPKIMEQYLALLDSCFSPSLVLAPLQGIEETVGCCPELFAERFLKQLPKFTTFLSNTREEVRESSAVIYSNIVVTVESNAQLKASMNVFLNNLETKSSNLEQQHGYLLAVANIVERKTSQNVSINDWEELKKLVCSIAMFLENGEPLVQNAACAALSQIGRVTSLPLTEKDCSKKVLVDRLIGLIKSNKTGNKVKERAIGTCGNICIGEQFPLAENILESLLELSKEMKDIDLHFSIGETIIMCLEGPASITKRDAWRITIAAYNKPEISETNLKLLEKFIENLLKIGALPHPNTRQAVCAYLLSIVKRLSHVPTLRIYQPKIQGMFMDLLSENNELVQDMASKGLALVYESGTAEQQKVLVAGLLDQLLAGKRSVQQVTGDTKLFEEGQLGSVPGGGNLSTYRELCSLASDLNQPDLVYKFMHLANHNAVWNSKKGAAFGFQTIANQANEQLNEYLPAVIPRLYRYQFDPTPRIQQSMANIWHSIVKDTSKTVDKYQKEILDDLLVNLTSNQWRVRSSCCAAVSDFFRGSRSVLDFKPKLSELWASLFRVMDDYHEATRQSAQNTAKVLANICVRVCDAERVKPDEEFIQMILEVFLKGITNSVAEVRQLSLQTVSQFVSIAGTSIKPSLITLIPALLEAAGELESVGLSHLSAQLSGHAQAQDMIDSVRASATKSHYTTQTVTKCVQYVDKDMLEELVPKILEVIKSVNLGSRVASAHLIILLSHHLGVSMEAFTGKFLAALVNGLLDRNPTIRKTFASTIGQILHTAKTSSVERLLAKLNTWYFEKEDSNIRSSLGATLHAIAQYNSELLKAHFPVVIPLVFFAMHDQKTEENKSHVEMWEEVWNEITPGTEAGIRQHLTEIIGLLDKAVTSPSWNMKAQAGRCFSIIAIRVDQNLEDVPRTKIVNLLTNAVQGRTFRGKEELITAMADLITHAPAPFRETQTCVDVVDVLLREAGKTDQAYRRHSLQALGNVLDTCTAINRFGNVYSIVQEMLEKLKKPDEDDDKDVEHLTNARNEKYKTLSVVYETLGKAWPSEKSTQLQYEDKVLAECLQTLELSPRDVQVSILLALYDFLAKLNYWNEPASDGEGLEKILTQVGQALVFALGIVKHVRLRKSALNIVWLLVQKLRKTERKKELDRLVATLKPSISVLEQDHSPDIQTRLIDLKNFLAKD